MKKLLCVTLAATVLCAPLSFADAPLDPAVQKGTNIGTIISAALKTALPEVSTLATAIAGIFTKKPDATQTKSITDQVDAAQKAIQAKVKLQVAAVKPIATELDVMGTFLQSGYRANAELSALIIVVGSHPAPTPSDWVDITARWKKVEILLDAIKYEPSQVDQLIKTANLKQVLQGLLEARNVTGGAIGVRISNKSRVDLLDDLKTLSEALSTLHVAARIEFSTLAADLNALSDWANNAAAVNGGPSIDPEVAHDTQAALAVLAKASAPRK